MCAEIRGKMISMQSGTFLYKESFHAVREAIYAEPQREWTLDGITRSMGISRSHFQRLYKEMFGKSCKEDIITARLERAKWLLKNTSISVADVAEQCGYLNTSHFIRQFSAKLALSPTEYRKQVKKEGGAQ
jgi:AraC-like DNA-binding protein